MKVLITGADGFIGSHVVEKLVKEGYEVKAFSYYNSFNFWGWLDYLDKEVMKNVEVFTGDIRDPNGVRKAMKGCDYVLHLAALIGIPYSYHSPDTYVDTNIKGTLNLLQAARDEGIKRFVHTSTSEVYGTAQYVPIDEKHPINPQSPYAATKAGADFMALSFYRSFELPIVILRPFNTYGPRQSARAIIPTIITQIRKGSDTIKLGNLKPTRDLTYVKDTANAFYKAMITDGINGEVISVGNGKEITMGDLVKLIGELMGADINVVQDKERFRPEKSEVMRLLCDNTKGKEKLGWEPEYSLREGLKETIEWFSNEENLKFYKPDIYNI